MSCSDSEIGGNRVKIMLQHWNSWRKLIYLSPESITFILYAQSVIRYFQVHFTPYNYSANKFKQAECIHVSYRRKTFNTNCRNRLCFLLLPLPQLVPQFKLLDVTLKEGSIGSIPE